MTRRLRTFLASATLASLSLVAAAQDPRAGRITTPHEELGHNFGDDYFLANYKQISAYWRKLDRESDRMVVQEIGKTAEGRPHLMAIVTSPANHARLARFRSISKQLALAEGLTNAQARALAKEGKAVVWIDGGLHATETLGAQQLGQMVYEMVSRTDDETTRLLNDCIILFVHANPDGNDLVADWYMRRADTLQRTTSGLPRLYQKYIGHDNNRDFFGSTQAETENINRVLYHEWFPQILYNHHQSGPAGTIFWSPPLRDPYNYNLHPALILGFQSLGAAMHTRLAIEGKPGATMRSGGPYDGWWNGGIRNTAAFHNVIALLTEMIGSPTPMRVPLVMQRQLPGADLAFPIAPQAWHFRQSIEYSTSLNRAVLDYASRMRENVLFNIYAMGKQSIERGNTDTWTTNPKRLAEAAARAPQQGAGFGGGAQGAAAEARVWSELRKPELRDPRAYIIPAHQADFPTATKFINALRETGITVNRATKDFTVQGKSYPSGSFVVFTAQPFRPHVIDMFEPQVHPDVFPIPGGPPTPPYDNAGWTLAFQMGVEFDRILEPFTGPFVKVTEWNLPMPVAAAPAPGAAGYVVSRAVNNSYIAVNRLLKAGAAVRELPDGRFHVPGAANARELLATRVAPLGVSLEPLSADPGNGLPLGNARIGLWDQYGGSMESGWTRWILEQFEFPFERVFAPTLDAGNLRSKYDVLVFVNGGIPGANARRRPADTASIPDLPAEYRDQFGRVTTERTLPRIQEFIEQGGTVVAIGTSAMNLATYLKLPVGDHLVENGEHLPRTKLFVPGSVLSARVDTALAMARGMQPRTDFFFDDSPVFSIAPDAVGVTRLAWFDTEAPLRSGWAWGQKHLMNGVAAVQVNVGRGSVILFGPEILQRAQPHATFKLLFNALYSRAAP
ncbi:MAG: M14 family metallopeptidase [Gemmatimonadota bacterium]